MRIWNDFFRSLKSEYLDRMIFFSRKQLERALQQLVELYHTERNHQGLENRLIDFGEEIGSVAGQIRCRERIGGLLKYYYRDAA